MSALAIIVASDPGMRSSVLLSEALIVRLAPLSTPGRRASHTRPLVRVSSPSPTSLAPQPRAARPTSVVPVLSASPAPARITGSTTARHVSSTAGGAALMGLGMIISGALGYIQTVAMTHMVSRSTYGVFVLVYTFAIFVSQLSKLGLDGVLLRFLPAYRARQEHRLAAGLSIFSFWIPAAVSLACALVLILLANPIALGLFHNEGYATPLREAALIIPLNGLQSIILNSLQAIRAVKWQVYVGRVIEPVATLALLSVFYLLGFRLEALIFAYIVGILISVVVGRIAFKRIAGGLIRAEPAYELGVWMRFGAAMLFNVMTVAVIQSTDVLGLGAFDTATQVSVYGAADRIGALIAMPFFALNIVFTPLISELHARSDLRQLNRLFALVTRWSFAVSWPICLCCVIFGAPILGIFGKGYAAGSAALIVLAGGSIINAATGPVTSMLAMTGQLRVLWFNTALRVILNIVLVLLLIPPYGVLGAAWASSLTVVILNLVSLVEVWWILKVQPYRWDMLKPLIAGAAGAVVGLLLMQVTQAGSPGASSVANFFAAIGLVSVFMLVYALAILWLGLTAEDREVFNAVRAKFFRA
jgi:O-antigen/teichoic acid export membrane protein